MERTQRRTRLKENDNSVGDTFKTYIPVRKKKKKKTQRDKNKTKSLEFSFGKLV